MVTVVSGKLGSGKTLDVVRIVRDHVAGGGCVRTNIRLDYRQIGRAVGRLLSPAQIGPLSAEDDPATIPTGDRRGHGPRRTLVVLDEALNWFQSEGKAGLDERKRKWMEWLRQSDKLGQDVYFIAQNFERAAKWIRELAQVSREIIPLRSVRLFAFVPMWWAFPPMRRAYMVAKRDVRSGQSIGFEFHRYRSAVWQLYDTSETFGFKGAASAYDAVHLWPAYRRPVLGLALALGGLLCAAATCIIC